MSTAIDLTPLESKPNCQWQIPGSKSLTNRAYILAALAEGTSILEGILQSDDTIYMRQALEKLGIGFTDISETSVAIQGGASRLQPSEEDLFIGNSGTSVRFLSALAALIPGTTTLRGDEHMAKRPIADLVEALTQLDIAVDCDTDCPPLSIHGGQYHGGTTRIAGNKSSQYLSALMMLGGIGKAPLHIETLGNLVSRPYVDMTTRMIADFGGKVTESQNTFTVHPCASYRNRSYHIEPDASAASYAFSLAAASGGSIQVPHLNAESMQGDIAYLEILEQMGATVERTPHYIRVQGPEVLQGVDVDMHHISDTVMSLAAIAPLCASPVTIRNVANIRIKETDRLAATVNELRKLGQGVEHGDDWLRITPQAISAAAIECYSDHRMAMSFAILGCVRPGVRITDKDCVAKTYPGFWQDLKRVYDSIKQKVDW